MAGGGGGEEEGDRLRLHMGGRQGEWEGWGVEGWGKGWRGVGVEGWKGRRRVI